MFATTLDLGPHQTLALPDIEGTALAVTRGTLWITQEDDTRDVVLGPGDLWMVERDGLTIIEAQNDASFRAVGSAFEREWKSAHEGSWWRRATRWLVPSAQREVPYY
ncbi:MAG: DUF2917 domain-containing protein [Burkholderiales bacterium]